MSEHEQIQVVQPQPVPVTVLADVLRGTGPLGEPKTACRVQLFTSAGSTVVFFDPENLKEIAGQLRMVANQAASGLIIPG